MEEFGLYLRSLREARGLSRPQLRDAIRDRFGDEARGISVKTLENWEGGKLDDGMSAGALARLVVVLGADYDEVFSRLVAAQIAARDARVQRAARAGHGDERTNRGQRQPRPDNESRRRSP